MPFWGISMAVHALAIIVVVFFSPVRETVFRRAKLEETQVITRGDELEEVIEQIRDRTVDRLRGRVALLEAGQERMARNFTTLNEFFQPFAEEQRSTARERMDRYIAEALPKQKTLADLLEAAGSDGDAKLAVAFAQTCTSRILTAQEEIRRGIRLLELGGEELIDRQEKAEEAQFSANQFLRWLQGDLLGIEREEARQDELQRQLVEQKALVPAAENETEDAQALVAATEEKLREIDEQWQQARATRDADGETVARAAMDMGRREHGERKHRVREAEQALRRATDDLKRTEAELERVRERLAQHIGRRSEHLVAARNVQAGAYAKQKDVVDAIAAFLGAETQ